MPAERGRGAAASAGSANPIDRRMRLGWVPAGLHTWRAADGAALFHRLRFVRPLRGEAGAELSACLESLHFDGRAWRGGEPAPPPGGRPVFMLPELLAADAALPVYVMPDETAASMLFSLGLPATTGAGAPPRDTDWSPLRDRRLRLWPVQGKAARRARRELLLHLRRLGHVVEELCWPSGADAAQGLAAAVAARPWRGRMALGKLSLLPGDAGLGKSLLAVSHLAKAGCGGASLYSVSGRLAFVAAARARHVVARDAAEPERRLLLPSKNKLGQDSTGLAWGIVPADSGAARLHWETAPVALDAEQAEAAAWLRDLLAEGGLHPAQVRRAGLRAGLGWRTLLRARRAAGVFTVCQGSGRRATYLWTLEPPEGGVEA